MTGFVETVNTRSRGDVDSRLMFRTIKATDCLPSVAFSSSRP